VAAVRRALQVRRVGHAGTLDPFATGLLLVLVGPATRLARYLVGLPKSYTGTIRLGIRTSTDDPTGEVLATSDAWRQVRDDDLQAAMRALCGSRLQIPPAFSAKHVGGRRAHRLARRGSPVALEPAPVVVHAFDLLGRTGPEVHFEARVGSGTYLRSLARDLGQILGCGAHLQALRRTAVGPFTLAEACSLEAVQRGEAILLPAAAAVRHLAPAAIGQPELLRLRHGQPIEAGALEPRLVALHCNGRLVAVAEHREGLWYPQVILPE
jgi:tRNA pseudouridine55 synthase